MKLRTLHLYRHDENRWTLDWVGERGETGVIRWSNGYYSKVPDGLSVHEYFIHHLVCSVCN